MRNEDQRTVALADYIRARPGFTFVERQPTHQHMGATIAEAILQSGMRYHAQVVPRVAAIIAAYPEATTSKAFLCVLVAHTPQKVIAINGRKAAYMLALTQFLAEAALATEADLRRWLEEAANAHKLLAIKGVGPKTISYLRLLVGSPTAVAVDTRLRAFLHKANIATTGYDDTVAVVVAAAALLGVTPATLDASIWLDADRR